MMVRCLQQQSWVGIMGMASCPCRTTNCGNGKERRWKQPSRGSLEEDSGTPGLGMRRGDIRAASASQLPSETFSSVDLRQDSQRLQWHWQWSMLSSLQRSPTTNSEAEAQLSPSPPDSVFAAGFKSVVVCP